MHILITVELVNGDYYELFKERWQYIDTSVVHWTYKYMLGVKSVLDRDTLYGFV